jgi:hypothetical protein
LPNFRSAIAFNVGLPEGGFGITLAVVFKSDHLSMIMLSVNASAPLLFLVAVVAFAPSTDDPRIAQWK